MIIVTIASLIVRRSIPRVIILSWNVAGRNEGKEIKMLSHLASLFRTRREKTWEQLYGTSWYNQMRQFHVKKSHVDKGKWNFLIRIWPIPNWDSSCNERNNLLSKSGITVCATDFQTRSSRKQRIEWKIILFSSLRFISARRLSHWLVAPVAR